MAKYMLGECIEISGLLFIRTTEVHQAPAVDRVLRWVRVGPQTHSVRRRRSGAGGVESQSPPPPRTHSKMRGKSINPITQQFLIRKVREMTILSPYGCLVYVMR